MEILNNTKNKGISKFSRQKSQRIVHSVKVKGKAIQSVQGRGELDGRESFQKWNWKGGRK